MAHRLRTHQDFISDLDFVALIDNQVVANIMFSASYLIGDKGYKLDTITFGPVSVLPEFQRQSIGTKLISHSIERAVDLGYNAIIIWGNPREYCKFGFKASKAYRISTPEKKYPCCLLVKELKSNTLSNNNWCFFESKAFEIDKEEFEAFDNTFEAQKKEFRYSQEEFAILSNAYL